MKNRDLSRWAESKAEDLREIADDLTWERRRAMELLKSKARQARRLLLERKRAGDTEPEPEAEEEDLTPYIQTPQQAREELTKKMDQTISRAYYKDGGFRYFGQRLLRYVKTDLPEETEVYAILVSGYNSCIVPMVRQLEKLENDLSAMEAESEEVAAELENWTLLETMRQFSFRTVQDRMAFGLHMELEDYRQIISRYANDLDAQLLTPYTKRSAQELPGLRKEES